MRPVPLLAAAALFACTYQPENPQIFVQVDGIPQAASRLDTELTDAAAGSPISYSSTFGPGTTSSLQLALAAPPHPESFHIRVDAFDPKGARLATGSADGALPAAGTLEISLATVSGSVGVYGSACDANARCIASQCEQYPTDPASGICTIGCTTNADCVGPAPAATCLPFPGGTAKFCQWDCTSGGQPACPANLFCHFESLTGRKFCEGD